MSFFYICASEASKLAQHKIIANKVLFINLCGYVVIVESGLVFIKTGFILEDQGFFSNFYSSFIQPIVSDYEDIGLLSAITNPMLSIILTALKILASVMITNGLYNLITKYINSKTWYKNTNQFFRFLFMYLLCYIPCAMIPFYLLSIIQGQLTGTNSDHYIFLDFNVPKLILCLQVIGNLILLSLSFFLYILTKKPIIYNSQLQSKTIPMQVNLNELAKNKDEEDIIIDQ